MKTTLFTLTAVLAVLTVARAAETVIQDDFDTPRSKPALNERTIESSSAIWEATPNLVVSRDGTGAVQVTDNNPFLAKVKLPPGGGVVVTAEVTPLRGIEKKGAWTAIGIGSFKGIVFSKGITWDGGLFCLLHDGGAFECYAIPPGKPWVPIKAKRAAPVSPGSTAKLSFQYQSANNSLTVWVNDVAVIQNAPLGDFHPSLDYAGFSAVNPKSGVTVVDNFSVVVTD